ncbi:MAG TPA: shikimate kinase [Bryobacteraceae bacterium]|nr:shikimate kinase [Bryobacteraceae bacterium]
MNLRLKRTPGVYVVGFMGSGKSTVGRSLADRLGWSFFDTDDEIEESEQMSISEIFELRGEQEFRDIETGVIRRYVRWIERGHPAVVALGGGAFIEDSNREMLADHGVTVWLDCPFEIVERRVARESHRPLARDPVKFAALYRARREIYQLADVHVPINCDDAEEAVEAILAHSLFR